MRRLFSTVVGVTLMLGPSAVSAAVVIIERTTSSKGTVTGTATVQIQTDRVRVDATSVNGTQIVIYRGDRGLFWMLDPVRKTYREMTKADLERLAGQMNDTMAQMREQIKSMPPEQQKMMEQMMAGKMGAMVKTGETVYKKVEPGLKVNQWTCDRYDGYRGDQKVWEVCASDWKQAGLTAADVGALQRLAQFFKGLNPNAADGAFAVGGGGGSGPGYDGVPVRRVSFSGGQPQTTFEVTEVRREDLAASLFELPKEFKKEALMIPSR